MLKHAKARQFSFDSIFLSSPKIASSQTLSANNYKNKVKSTISLNTEEPWRKPLILELNLKSSSVKFSNRQDNLIKKRKLMSTLKYKKIVGDKVRKNSLKQEVSIEKIQQNRSFTSKISGRSQLQSYGSSRIQAIKKTLINTCQSKPIKLQSRPLSSKRTYMTQPNQIKNTTAKLQQLLQRIKPIVITRQPQQKKKQYFHCLSGW